MLEARAMKERINKINFIKIKTQSAKDTDWGCRKEHLTLGDVCKSGSGLVFKIKTKNPQIKTQQ